MWWAFIEIKRTICWDDLYKLCGKDIVVVQTVPNLEVDCEPKVCKSVLCDLEGICL